MKLDSRGKVLKIASFEGPKILRDIIIYTQMLNGTGICKPTFTPPKTSQFPRHEARCHGGWTHGHAHLTSKQFPNGETGIFNGDFTVFHQPVGVMKGFLIFYGESGEIIPRKNQEPYDI